MFSIIYLFNAIFNRSMKGVPGVIQFESKCPLDDPLTEQYLRFRCCTILATGHTPSTAIYNNFRGLTYAI